jgi:hypothetical protein
MRSMVEGRERSELTALTRRPSTTLRVVPLPTKSWGGNMPVNPAFLFVGLKML